MGLPLYLPEEKGFAVVRIIAELTGGAW